MVLCNDHIYVEAGITGVGNLNMKPKSVRSYFDGLS